MTSPRAPSPSGRAPIRFGYVYTASGGHPAGWRYQGGKHDPFDPAHVTRIAQLAEEGGFDFIHFAERRRSETAQEQAHPDAIARTEGFTTASFLATRTKRIGFVVTANASYFEPFNLARLTASLDHVTHGRAGWAISTGASAPAAQNYSREEASPAAHRARALEVVQVLRNLWDSWEDSAFIRNKATGEYVDGSKIRPIHHQGALFNIKGPLNVARPPQGQLVIAQQIGPNDDLTLAAQEADIVLLSDQDMEQIAKLAKDIRARAGEAGRDPSQLTVLAEITPIVAPTTTEARAIYDALNALIIRDQTSKQSGKDNPLQSLSHRVGVDLANLALDATIDSELAGRLNKEGQALLDVVTERTGRQIDSAVPPRVADLLYAHLVPGIYLIGDATHVADGIEALVTHTGVDGITVRPAALPDLLQAYVDHLTPELRARGLLIEHPGDTLREQLGLAAPANRLAAA